MHLVFTVLLPLVLLGATSAQPNNDALIHGDAHGNIVLSPPFSGHVLLGAHNTTALAAFVDELSLSHSANAASALAAQESTAHSIATISTITSQQSTVTAQESSILSHAARLDTSGAQAGRISELLADLNMCNTSREPIALDAQRIRSIAHFTMGQDDFLAVSSFDDNASVVLPMPIYRYNRTVGQFQVFQNMNLTP
jgi:hypothetical protein